MKFNPISLKNIDQTTHGMSHTPTYKSWQAMRRRVKAKDKAKWYFGIKVCYRWREFEHFYADMGDRPIGTSLDRIDNNKGYEPGNCRWATRIEQANNKRSNATLEFNGKRQCIAQWARETGLGASTIQWRLSRGWPANKALSTKMFYEESGRRPYKMTPHILTRMRALRSVNKSYKAIGKICGVSADCARLWLIGQPKASAHIAAEAAEAAKGKVA